MAAKYCNSLDTNFRFRDEAYGLTLCLVTLIAGTSLRRTSGRGLLQLFCQGRGLKSRIQGSLRSLREQLSWTKPPRNTTQKVSAYIFQIGPVLVSLLLSSKTFPENWDSKAPSVGTLLAYLETTA